MLRRVVVTIVPMVEITRAEKSQLIAGLVSLVVYVVVAWIAANIFGGAIWRVGHTSNRARIFRGCGMAGERR